MLVIYIYIYFSNNRQYVKAYIDFPKPLIALINGPAVGVSVTVLGLFDVVYATESVSRSLDVNSLTITQVINYYLTHLVILNVIFL